MQTAFTSQPVDGVLLLDKPVGITSNAAIQRVKRLLRAAKAGHVGTLDPLASGLLPVCLGEATKFSTSTFSADKSYEAEIVLGVTTTTGDSEGDVTSRHLVTVVRAQVERALQRFIGTIAQTPPMYSALKRDGRPLYAYARAGLTVALEPRNVTIYDIALCSFHTDRLRISVRCSKGTYIRVLAEDIGRALGCGASLAELRRTGVAEFQVARATTLEQLESAPERARTEFLMPIDSLVAVLPAVQLEDKLVQRMMTGQAVRVDDAHELGIVRLYDQEQRFLGLGDLQEGGHLVPKRMTAIRDVGPAGTSYMTTANP